MCICAMHALVAWNIGNDRWSCMHAGVCGAVVLDACTYLLQHRLHLSLQHTLTGVSTAEACQVS